VAKKSSPRNNSTRGEMESFNFRDPTTPKTSFDSNYVNLESLVEITGERGKLKT